MPAGKRRDSAAAVILVPYTHSTAQRGALLQMLAGLASSRHGGQQTRLGHA
jgi:hypothetical protein